MSVFVITLGDVIGLTLGALVIVAWASATVYDIVKTKLKGK